MYHDLLVVLVVRYRLGYAKLEGTAAKGIEIQMCLTGATTLFLSKQSSCYIPTI